MIEKNGGPLGKGSAAKRIASNDQPKDNACPECVARRRMFAARPLDIRRYPPTGDVATWVRYGPAGPPAEDAT